MCVCAQQRLQQQQRMFTCALHVEPCVAQCRCVALSRDTIRLHDCMLHDEVGAKQEVVSKQEVVFTEATDARANVAQCGNEIQRDCVRVNRAR